MNVKNVVISIQKEENSNIKKLIKIINNKKINLILVKKNDRINIEKNLYIDIIWPDNENLISENAINNNSLVCKLIYNDFSILFTGDIEKVAEENILNEKTNLDAKVLKVAHHGSNTSSIQKFIEKVNPKIVLIGVGENNKFGHPNMEILNQFKRIGSKIYRTDLDGEVIIVVNRKGKITSFHKNKRSNLFRERTAKSCHFN